jgi:hypothetical protein
MIDNNNNNDKLTDAMQQPWGRVIYTTDEEDRRHYWL